MLSPILLLKVLVYLFHLHQAVQSGLTTNPEFPPSSFCSKKCVKSEDEPNHENFPLYRCSCSESCSTFGDCCHDSPFINDTPQHSIEFMCISIAGLGRFKAVSNCPPDNDMRECKEEIGNYVPVTSKETNITYANIFCAMCNDDVNKLQTWIVELRCASDLVEDSNDTFNIPTRYVYLNGEIWSLNEADDSKKLCMYHVLLHDYSFMKGLEFRKCTEPKRISECPASWTDLSVSKMCRSYEDPVYFHDTEYRNAHCAICNYQNLEFLECIPFTVKVMAKMRLDDTRVREYCEHRVCTEPSKLGKGQDYAFSELFNVYSKECVPPRGRKCCAGKAFDKRTGKCRKVRRD